MEETCGIEFLDEARKARFDRLCREAVRARPNLGDAGIGTLAEKCLHAVVKQFLCADSHCHEVQLENTRFVSDVRIGNEIYEVQTGDFYPMKRKIGFYLSNTDCTVTVVHPIAVQRWMSWVDPTTMEIEPRKRVSRKGRPIDLLPQLAALSEHLQNPRLRFRLLLLETYDFRLLDGTRKDRKKHATHYERIPLSMLGEMTFSSPADFRAFLPQDLPSHFTVKQFSRLSGLRGRDAYSAVRALAALGLVASADPIGRSMGWQIV
ncbi:MAG: hypothetical protein E7637_09370 [Ruminococcaceae bacterium]|nr:hypothetical protein [Oscillospiraceae bacterium]